MGCWWCEVCSVLCVGGMRCAVCWGAGCMVWWFGCCMHCVCTLLVGDGSTGCGVLAVGLCGVPHLWGALGAWGCRALWQGKAHSSTLWLCHPYGDTGDTATVRS